MNKIELDRYFSRTQDSQIETVLTHAPISLVANGSSEISVPVPSQYNFIAAKISGTSTGAYTVKMSSTGDEFPFSNKALHSTAFIGNGNIPYVFPQLFLLKRRQGLRFEVADISGSANTIQIQVHGYAVYKDSVSAKFEEKFRQYLPYFYTTDSTFTLGTSDTDQTVSIERDFDFLCTKMSYADANGSTGIQMKVSHSSGVQMQNSVYLDVDGIMGNAQYPKQFVYPTLFGSGSIITVTAKDTSANTFYVVFGGIVTRVKNAFNEKK